MIILEAIKKCIEHAKSVSAMRCVMLALSLLAPLYSAGCGPQLTLMSEAQEAKIGAQQHDKIVAQHGGIYDSRLVNDYVQNIMQKIAAASGRPDIKFQITVLDTPVVNAFALPGGYTYVTRGLLALANSEAEVAGVVGHEIGHVTARHSAQRHTAAFGTAVLAGVLGGVAQAQVPGSADIIEDILNMGSGAALAGYSRNQEYEADSIGIQTSFRAGYQPTHAANFLASLGRETAFQSKLSKRDRPLGADWFATHPNTEDRVARARGLATSYALGRDNLREGRASHLNAIDGLTYGHGAHEGFVRGQSFIHPNLKVYFEVPKGFSLKNAEKAVTATDADGQAIVFDMRQLEETASLETYIRDGWLGDPASGITSVTVSGYEAALAQFISREHYYRALVVRGDNGKIYRFLSRMKADDEGRALARVQSSLRLLKRFNASIATPLKINVISVKAGDTITSLAMDMAVSDHHVERFKLLNGLSLGQSIKVGQRLKTIK